MGSRTANVLLVGPWLARYVSVVRDLVTTPVSVSHTPVPSDEETAIAPLLRGVDVLVTNVFSERLGGAATDLQLLQLPGSGYDRIDFDAVPAAAQVAVCYEHQRGIAEFVLMQAMALSRRIQDYDRRLRAGDWTTSMIAGDTPAHELRGRTIGIIGYGRIGREIAGLARHFDMRVLAYRRGKASTSTGPLPDVSFGPGELHELLRNSDVVVVALPLTDETRGLIGPAEFAAMKPDAILVNPARGPIIHEESLYKALSTRRIAGAAIDVWYQYPKVGSERLAPSRFPMHELDNLIMTPHISGYTDEMARGRMSQIARNIDRLARREPLENRIDNLYQSLQQAR